MAAVVPKMLPPSLPFVVQNEMRGWVSKKEPGMMTIVLLVGHKPGTKSIDIPLSVLGPNNPVTKEPFAKCVYHISLGKFNFTHLPADQQVGKSWSVSVEPGADDTHVKITQIAGHALPEPIVVGTMGFFERTSDNIPLFVKLPEDITKIALKSLMELSSTHKGVFPWDDQHPLEPKNDKPSHVSLFNASDCITLMYPWWKEKTAKPLTKAFTNLHHVMYAQLCKALDLNHPDVTSFFTKFGSGILKLKKEQTWAQKTEEVRATLQKELDNQKLTIEQVFAAPPAAAKKPIAAAAGAEMVANFG